MSDPLECSAVGKLADFTEANRITGLVIFVFGTLYYLGTILWWYKRRERFFLKKRSLTFVAISSFGGWLQLFLTGVGTYVGRNSVPCDIYLTTAYLIVPIAAGPVVVRLILFRNTASYNEMLMAESDVGFQSGLFRRLSVLESLQLLFKLVFCHCCRDRKLNSVNDDNIAEKSVQQIGWKNGSRGIAKHLFTTKFYGYCVMSVFALISLVALSSKFAVPNSPYGHGCFGCTLSTTDTAIFSAIIFIIVVVGLYILAMVRKVPDPLRIIHELELVLMAGIVVIVGMVLSFLDPGNLAKEGQFEWLFIASLGILLIHTIQCPMQILKTYAARRVLVDADTLTIDQVLDSPSGRQAFVEYLSTEFSLENFYFFEAVARYKADFSYTSTDERLTLAKEIAEKYLRENSLLEVNISFNCKRRTYAVVNGPDDPLISLFDEAQAEVKELMRGDSFERFLRSDIFKDWSKDKSSAVSVHSLHDAL